MLEFSSIVVSTLLSIIYKSLMTLSYLQISLTPNFTVQCAWFQPACNPRSSRGCQCSVMFHLLLYVIKWQLTICFKSSKPIQIGRRMLMSLSIHIHDLHLNAQYGQMWHLGRHNYAVQRGLVVGFCGQPHYCYWSYNPTGRFWSPSSYMVSAEPFPDRSRPMPC